MEGWSERMRDTRRRKEEWKDEGMKKRSREEVEELKKKRSKKSGEKGAR